jgi:TetR/AcrR family transcriptional regulator, cholesterol catabolism regulator
MPKGIPLTKAEQSNRRREIISASVNLFLAQGFPETSMREIAEAAGMGKSSLYDYFKTKDDILLFIIEDVTAKLTEQAQAIAGLNLPPDTRIKQIMDMQLAYLQANNNLFWMLSAEAQRLHLESQKRIQKQRYAYQDLVCALVEEGILQGCFRKVDALLAARLLINTLLSVLFTSRPTGSAQEMLDEAVDIFLRGIKL